MKNFTLIVGFDLNRNDELLIEYAFCNQEDLNINTDFLKLDLEKVENFIVSLSIINLKYIYTNCINIEELENLTNFLNKNHIIFIIVINEKRLQSYGKTFIYPKFLELGIIAVWVLPTEKNTIVIPKFNIYNNKKVALVIEKDIGCVNLYRSLFNLGSYKTILDIDNPKQLLLLLEGTTLDEKTIQENIQENLQENTQKTIKETTLENTLNNTQETNIENTLESYSNENLKIKNENLDKINNSQNTNSKQSLDIKNKNIDNLNNTSNIFSNESFQKPSIIQINLDIPNLDYTEIFYYLENFYNKNKNENCKYIFIKNFEKPGYPIHQTLNLIKNFTNKLFTREEALVEFIKTNFQTSNEKVLFDWLININNNNFPKGLILNK